MTPFDGFLLPDRVLTTIRDWDVMRVGQLNVRHPSLSPAQIERTWQILSQNRRRILVHKPVADIAAAIGAAASQIKRELADVTRLVSAATGYSAPVVSETLEHMLDDWSQASLHELLRSELRDARVLDGSLPDPVIAGKQVAAFGYDQAFHIFSGNVPGVGVTSLIRSLLVKSATLCKTASGEPVLAVLFARALQHVDAELASCLAVSYWPHDAEAQSAALSSADIVVVYGGDSAIAGARSRVRQDAKLVLHGPRVSFGIVGPHATRNIAQSVATAVAAYDQQGCVSPHVVYVVGEPEKARSFASDVANQLRDLAATSPRGALSPEEAVAIRNARAAAEFGGTTELFGSDTDGFSVIYDEAPRFEISCLNRVLYVKPLATAGEVVDVLPRASLLQSAAVEGFEENEKAELVRMLGLAGVSRVTTFVRLPWPPMHWRHDGSAPLGELVRWQDVES